MAGREERHHLVAKLLVAHPFARLLVAPGHQQAQEVVGGLAGAAALGDDALNRPLEPCQRGARAPRARAGNPGRPAEEVERIERAEGGIDRGDRPADIVYRFGHVHREQRPGNDLHRQRRHFFRDVERLPPLARHAPALHPLPGKPGHGAGGPRETLTMKARGRDAPLAPPQRTLAGHQPVAEHRPEGVADDAPLRIVAMVGQQNVLDEARVVDENEVAEEHLLLPEPGRERLAVEHGDGVLVDHIHSSRPTCRGGGSGHTPDFRATAG